MAQFPVSIPIRPVPVSEICHKTLAPELTRRSSGSYKYLPELLNTHFRYCARIPQCTPGSSRTILSVSCGRPCSVWQMEEHSCNTALLKFEKRSENTTAAGMVTLFRIGYSVRVSVLGLMLTMLTNAIPRMVNLASRVPHLVLQTLLAARLT